MKQPAKQNAIVKQVLAEINGMKYPDGKLPTEAELCQQFRQAAKQSGKPWPSWNCRRLLSADRAAAPT